MHKKHVDNHFNKKHIVNKVTSFIAPSLLQLKRKFYRKYSLYDVSTPAGKSQCTAGDWFPGRPFICSAQRVKYVMVQNGVGRTLKPNKCLFRSEIQSVSSRKPYVLPGQGYRTPQGGGDRWVWKGKSNILASVKVTNSMVSKQ